MKMMFAVLLCLVSLNALAQQPRKMTLPSNAVSPSQAPYTVPGQNEITALLGLNAGAPNFGVSYVAVKPDFGFGGYFFMQSSKDKNNVPIVNQIMSFGGMLKINLVENRLIQAYFAPGFGITIVKDGSINASGGKSDETVFGPSFKIGAQYKMTPNFKLGLERFQFTNWLNDSLNNFKGSDEHYSVAGTFEF